jgi:proteasome accessory factor C
VRAKKKAPQDASAQLKRVLALTPRFGDGEEHPYTEIAAALDVDAKTIMRDLESFGERFDTPGAFVEGLEVYLGAKSASVRTNHFKRPMRLTVPELHALDLGLAMLRTERPPAEWPAIERARERIKKAVAVLPSEPLPANPYDVSTETAGVAHLGVIRQALSKHKKLVIAYRGGAATEPTSRTICPYRLLLAGPVWYLIAHCERSSGLRSFRVDRIETAEVSADSCEKPDLSALDAARLSGSKFVSDAPVKLRVRFSATIARWLREREEGTEEADGSFVVEYPLADLDWAVRYVLRYGPEAEILDPPEARAAIRERLGAMLS